MLIFYKKLHKFQTLREITENIKNSKNHENVKENLYNRIWHFAASFKYERV